MRRRCHAQMAAVLRASVELSRRSRQASSTDFGNTYNLNRHRSTSCEIDVVSLALSLMIGCGDDKRVMVTPTPTPQFSNARLNGGFVFSLTGRERTITNNQGVHTTSDERRAVLRAPYEKLEREATRPPGFLPVSRCL